MPIFKRGGNEVRDRHTFGSLQEGVDCWDFMKNPPPSQKKISKNFCDPLPIEGLVREEFGKGRKVYLEWFETSKYPGKRQFTKFLVERICTPVMICVPIVERPDGMMTLLLLKDKDSDRYTFPFLEPLQMVSDDSQRRPLRFTEVVDEISKRFISNEPHKRLIERFTESVEINYSWGNVEHIPLKVRVSVNPGEFIFDTVEEGKVTLSLIKLAQDDFPKYDVVNLNPTFIEVPLSTQFNQLPMIEVERGLEITARVNEMMAQGDWLLQDKEEVQSLRQIFCEVIEIVSTKKQAHVRGDREKRLKATVVACITAVILAVVTGIFMQQLMIEDR